MAVAFDAATTGGNAGSATLTFAHTVSGTDRVLIVAFTANKLVIPPITGVTYNSVAMTAHPLSPQSLPTDATVKVYLYYLLNPSTGSNNVTITFTATLDEIRANAVSYTGVLSVPQFMNVNGSGTSATLTTTTTADNSWLAGCFRNNSDGDGNAGSGTFKRSFVDGQNGFYDTNGAKTPPGSYSIISTFGSAEYGALGVSLSPLAVPATNQAFMLMGVGT